MAITPESDDWLALRPQFPDYPGARAIVHASLLRIGDSCGFAVPRLEHFEERNLLVRFSDAKGPEGLQHYRNEKNARSLDGLPGLPPRP